MKSEDKWVFLENILQTFAQMQRQVNQAVIAVVEHAHAVVQEMQMQS